LTPAREAESPARRAQAAARCGPDPGHESALMKQLRYKAVEQETLSSP